MKLPNHLRRQASRFCPVCVPGQWRGAAAAEGWAIDEAAKQWRVLGVVLLLAVCNLLQGCVGAGIAWTHTAGCSNPDLEYLQHGKLRSRGAADTNDTPAWLQTNWGEPTYIKRIGKEETTEVWTYEDDLNWNGAMLFVLIPIPLEVPVGHEWTKVVIQDGRVISAKLRSTRASGGILGYAISAGPCNIKTSGFGFHSLSDLQ